MNIKRGGGGFTVYGDSLPMMMWHSVNRAPTAGYTSRSKGLVRPMTAFCVNLRSSVSDFGNTFLPCRDLYKFWRTALCAPSRVIG